MRQLFSPLPQLAWPLAMGLAIASLVHSHSQAQTIITGPTGSGAFGTSVTVLPNGNYVVTDPSFDQGSVQDVGAVYLYNGSTNALISTLTGTIANRLVPK